MVMGGDEVGYTGQERRRFPRAEFPCKITLSFSHREFTIHTENISKGGIKVILDEKIEFNSLVGLELTIIKDRPIQCEGRITWVVETLNPVEGKPVMFNIGIAFVNMRDDDRECIKQLVDTLLGNT